MTARENGDDLRPHSPAGVDDGNTFIYCIHIVHRRFYGELLNGRVGKDKPVT